MDVVDLKKKMQKNQGYNPSSHVRCSCNMRDIIKIGKK